MKNKFKKDFVDVDGKVCFGRKPLSSADFDFLKSQKVTAIVYMGSEGVESITGGRSKQGVEYFSFKSGNFFDILAGVLLSNPKRKIFFHCDYGMRTYGAFQQYKAVIGRRSSYSGNPELVKNLKDSYLWAFFGAAERLGSKLAEKRLLFEFKRVGLKPSPRMVELINQGSERRRIFSAQIKALKKPKMTRRRK